MAHPITEFPRVVQVDVDGNPQAGGGGGSASEETQLEILDKLVAAPALESKQDTTNTHLTNLFTLIGEVQASPTTNTELDRLKRVETALTSTNTKLDTLIAQGGSADPVPVETHIQYVDVTLTLETTILDAGDVAAATQIVAAATSGNDKEAILQNLVFIDPDDQKAACSFIFFSSNVTYGTEDSAPSISDGDAASILGTVSLVAADYTDHGGVATASLRNIGMIVKPAAGTDDIYVAMSVVATPTYAGGSATLRLGFLS